MLLEPNIFKKIEIARKSYEDVTRETGLLKMPTVPARDVEVLHTKLHPPKEGFSTKAGQARMLHDLASIELQAMELGVRTLCEFPDAPAEFREELYHVTKSESKHLEMCLIEIEKLGYKWGDWPVHTALWAATSSEDSLIDRILIVHRYLEGSGLDAGDTLLRRLAGVDAKGVLLAVQKINVDEVGHVEFGSRWYRRMCEFEKIDPNKDFTERMDRLRWTLPKRIEPISESLRRRAGFSEEEIAYMKAMRESYFDKHSVFKKS